MKVYVVTGTDLGWDNVCGVFDPDNVSLKELEKVFQGNYYIQLVEVSTNLLDWE